MKTKKSFYHYIAYVVFALIFFCSIALYAINIVEINGSTDYLIPVLLRYIIVVAGILVLIYGYQILLKYIPSKYKIKQIPEISALVEVGIVFLIFLVFAFPRLIHISDTLGEHELSQWLNFALYNTDTLPDTSMLSFVYGSFLRIFTLILNSEYIIYAANIILELGTVTFTFFMFRENMNKLYAYIASFLVAIMPGLSNQCTLVNPSIFYTLLISAYLYCLFHLVKMNKNRRIDSEGKIIFYILLAILGGFILCLDISGIVILFITIPLLILLKTDEPNFKSCSCVTQCIVMTLTEIISAFLFLFFINNNGLSRIDNVSNYINSFIPEGLSLEIYPAFDTFNSGIVIYIFVGIAICSFIRSMDDSGLIYVLFTDFASICIFILFNSSEYTYLINYSWCLLGAIGLMSIPSFVLSDEEQRAAEKKKIENAKKKEQRKFKKEFSKDKGISLEMTDEVPEEETTGVSLVPTPDSKISSSLSFKNSDNSNEKEETPIENENKNTISKVVDLPPQIPGGIDPISGEYREENKPSSGTIINGEKENDAENTVFYTDKKEDSVSLTDINSQKAPISSVFGEPQNNCTNIIPSRREYKTAHVYKSEEEKLEHEDRLKIVPVNNSVPAELKGKPSFIKNPLPGPKPHVTRELAYDYDLAPSDMDFDITDMKGKDFYDI